MSAGNEQAVVDMLGTPPQSVTYQTAWRSMYLAHWSVLVRYAASLLHDVGEAEDVVQCTFISAMEHMGRFEYRSTLRVWLVRIVRNKCLNRLRDRRRRRHLCDREFGGFDGLVDGAQEHALNVREAKALLDRALDELTPAHRAIIVLREIDGLAYEEIAELLNIRVGTVMSRLFRARTHLREAAEEYMTHDDAF